MTMARSITPRFQRRAVRPAPQPATPTAVRASLWARMVDRWRHDEESLEDYDARQW